MSLYFRDTKGKPVHLDLSEPGGRFWNDGEGGGTNETTQGRLGYVKDFGFYHVDHRWF